MSFRASGALATRLRGIYHIQRGLRNGTGRFLAGVHRALRVVLARNDKGGSGGVARSGDRPQLAGA
ncbi:MAG: hypothetical protein U9R05_11505 [Chloroflexota bacterium]|nr:hypothetical protein [Chloroflexota bacterium]